MAYNEDTAKRVENILSSYKNITQKKMFGGLCFLMDEKMILGVNNDNLLVRVNPEESEKLIKNGIKQMVHNGREMRGFLYVEESEYKNDKDLESWINISVEFVKTLPAKKKK